MGREAPPEAATLRSEAPRLAKLSASSASPAGSPRRAAVNRAAARSSHDMASSKVEAWQLAAAGAERANGSGAAAVGAWGMAEEGPRSHNLPEGAAHAATDSLGGASDEADPTFLRMLASTLPTEEEESGGGGRRDGGGAVPATIAKLNALNGRSHSLAGAGHAARPAAHSHSGAASAAAANGHAAHAGEGKQHKKDKQHKGFFGGLFHRKDGKQQDRKEREAAEAGAADVGPSGGSESGGSASSGSKQHKGKKKGWFGGSKHPAGRSPRVDAAAGAGERPEHGSAGAQRSDSGVMLPGLPLTELGGRRGSAHSMASSSADGSSLGAGAAEGGGGAAAAAGRAAALAGGSRAVGASPSTAGLTDSSATDPSAPSTAHPSPAIPGGLGLPADGSDFSASGGKKGHRRRHSLTSMLLPGNWRRRSRTASAGSEAEMAGDITPPNGASYGPSRTGSPAPRTAEALAAAAAASGAYASCFGLAAGQGADGELVVPPVILEEPLPLPPLPAGTTGLKNIGNTCFVNAALQCLRYTPGLPLHVAPDLLDLAEQAQQRQGGTPLSPGRAGSASLSRSTSGVLARSGSGTAPAVLSRSASITLATLARAGSTGAGGAAAAEGEEAAPAEDIHQQALARVSSVATKAAPSSSSSDAGGGSRSGRGEEEGGKEEAAPEAAAGGEAQHAQQQDGEAQHAQQQDGEQQQAEQQQGEQQDDAQAPAAAPAAPAAPVPAGGAGPSQRPAKGALLESFAEVVRDLYVPPPGSSAVCAAPLLRTLRAFPIAADYFDGGQHDCQEVLRVLMDLLHDDLNRVQRPAPGQPAGEGEQPASGEGSPASEAGERQANGTAEPSPRQQQEEQEQEQEEGQPAEDGDETAKADRIWEQQLERDSSVITDLFGGQLQSSVTCHKCGGRFTMYEPFWDLSLPLAKEGKGAGFSWLGLKGTPATIQDCLSAFTADEKLEGAEAFHCEKCGEKTPATKHLRVHRFPEVLVLQIKRFKYKGASTDKLTASVSFPLKELRLHQYASPECPAGPQECCYDLYAVSNHYGNLSGGHYTAMCKVPLPGSGGEAAWYSFNDEQVTRINASQVVSQYAYILFYVRSRRSSAAAAAAEASRSHHRRNASSASAGAGASA